MATEYKLLFGLENQFNDTTGQPVIGGYLYAYKASAHTTKKNISKVRSPSVPADFYENPTTLSSEGGMPEPYLIYLADDELYYFVLTTADQNPLDPPEVANILKTWDNVGPNEQGSPKTDEVDYTNYILNAQYFYHRYDSLTQDDFTVSVDNYVADTGWYFRTDQLPANMTVAFNEFSPGQTEVPNTPKYYLSYTCNTIGTSESEKDVFIESKNVRSFNGETIQISFWGKSTFNSQVELMIEQDFGTGGSAKVTSVLAIQLTSSWAQYTQEIDVPSILGKTIGTDSRLLIGLRAPLNSIAEYDVTNWQLNRGDVLLEFNYKTPEIDAESKRTYYMPDPADVDIDLSLKWDGSEFLFNSAPIGLVSMGFGESLVGYILADGSTYSTLDKIPETNNKVSYSRLFDYWDENVPVGQTGWYTTYNGNAFGYGADGFYPTAVFGNDAAFVNTKVETDITLWADNDTGFTFSKTRTGADYNYDTFKSDNFSVPVDISFERGPHNFEVQFEYKSFGVLPTPTVGDMGGLGLSLNIISLGTVSANARFICAFDISDATTIAGKYWEFSTASTNYYVWYHVNGVGADPAVAGRTGIRVDLTSAYMDGSIIAELTRLAIAGTTQHLVTAVAASTLSGGEYFNFYNSTNHYVGYITIDGVGTDPNVAATTSIEIPLLSTDTASEVRDKLCKNIARIFFQVPDMRGWGIRGAALDSTRDPNKEDRYLRGDMARNSIAGSLQLDSFKEHRHRIKTSTSASGGGKAVDTQLNDIGIHTEYSGEAETRMLNIAVNFFVKY